MVAVDERGEFCGNFAACAFFVVFEGFEDFFLVFVRFLWIFI